MQLEGVVKRINAKPYKGRKSGTVYSFLLIQNSGEETWVTFGFDKEPPFAEGDRIAVEANKDQNGYLNYVEGTGRIVASKADTKPAASQSTATTEATSTGTPQRGNASGGYDERQRQIVWQHSQEMAIAAVGLLLQHDGLPMSVAKTKAAQSQRFEEITAAIDKQTVKFYNDVITGRVLEHVADAGVVDTSAPDGIPPADPKPQQQQSTSSNKDF